MNLKTATLISLIGIIVYTVISLFRFFFQLIMAQMDQASPRWVHRVLWMVGIVLLNGSIILFLAVLYTKQKMSNKVCAMSQDINGVLEIGSQLVTVHDERATTTSFLAKASFCLGVVSVPAAIVSSLISQFVIYNPPLTALNTMLLYLVLIVTPLSVLLGIAALIRIPLSKKTLRGYRLAITGVVISLVSFVVTAYYLITNMSWA